MNQHKENAHQAAPEAPAGPVIAWYADVRYDLNADKQGDWPTDYRTKRKVVLGAEPPRTADNWKALVDVAYAPDTQQAVSQMDVAAVDARDWVEDAPHENGNYQCLCSTCGYTFIGHKRRVTCKACAATTVSASTRKCAACGGRGYLLPLGTEAVDPCHTCDSTGRAQAPSREAAPLDLREALGMCIKALEHAGIGKATREAALDAARAALAQQGASHAASAGDETERDETPQLLTVAKAICERWDATVPESEVSDEHKQLRAALASSAAQEAK